jgi:tetratricopeptide (TPR) repeat protein
VTTNFVSIIKRIIAEQGEDILTNPAQLKGFVADYAAHESKPERLAFGRCIEYGAYTELKNAPDAEARLRVKAAVAQRVNNNEGLDLTLCKETMETLEAVMFSVATQPEATNMVASAVNTTPTRPQSVMKKQKKVLMATRVMSIIGIVWCVLWVMYFFGQNDMLQEDFFAFIQFAMMILLFMLPHAIVTLVQGIKHKRKGMIIMAILGIIVYVSMLLVPSLDIHLITILWTFIGLVYTLAFSVITCIQPAVSVLPVTKKQKMAVAAVVTGALVLLVVALMRPVRMQIIEKLVEQGSNYSVFHDDYDQAITNFNKALKLDPNYAPAYYNRGIAFRNKDDFDSAIADFTQAIRLDPNYADAYNGRGIVYAYKNDSNRAIADYTQAIRLNPDFEYVYINRASVYIEIGEYDKAIADYTQAIRFAASADRYIGRGNAYIYKGEYDKAEADYNEAKRIQDELDELRQQWEE